MAQQSNVQGFPDGGHGWSLAGQRSDGTSSEGIEQHTVGRSTLLHLLPGVLILGCFVLLIPVVRSLGFPSLMAIFLAETLVLVPVELGYLLWQGKQRNGRLSLGGVVLYRERLPLSQFILLVLGLLVWSGLVLATYGATDRVIIDALFRWLPDWFFLSEGLSAYSRPALLGMWVLGLVVNAFAGPIVEELYFRGYLLPRISRLGRWAPVLNTVLFSLYHFFTPWQNIGRILGLLPMVYAVWWKRSIYIGVAVHVLGNLYVMLAMLPLVLG
ncbi:MAG: CPBP family intramembrane metalloprotease [Chloroflexota bacterium]|nr:CPBP family intramembrane metalloprotease [Chloroflexota bacterium]